MPPGKQRLLINSSFPLSKNKALYERSDIVSPNTMIRLAFIIKLIVAFSTYIQPLIGDSGGLGVDR